MNTIDRPEGFKEKRAELTVQQIQNLGGGFNLSSPPVTETYSRPPATAPVAPVAPVASTPQPTSAVNYESSRPAPPPATPKANVPPRVSNSEPAPQPANFERTTYPAVEEPNIDDIPF
jgi:hypothetical protein